MDADSGNCLPAFGFLTILESPEHGVFGGYLVLSPLGRPLEFRCSTPVVPSRAQEILYGRTLRPYLFADVIGQALLAGSELPVQVILTNQRDMLALGMLRSEPVVHVEPIGPEVNAAESWTPDSDDAFEFAGHRLATSRPGAEAAHSLRNLLAPLAAHCDLSEPFNRIREALTEAQMASQDDLKASDDDAAAA